MPNITNRFRQIVGQVHRSINNSEGGGTIPELVIEVRQNVYDNWDEDTHSVSDPEIISDTKATDVKNALNKGIWPVIKYWKEVEEIEDGESYKYTQDEQYLKLCNYDADANTVFYNFIGTRSFGHQTFYYSVITLTVPNDGDESELRFNLFDIADTNNDLNDLANARPVFVLDVSNMTYVEDYNSVPVYEITDEDQRNMLRGYWGLGAFDNVRIGVQGVYYTPTSSTIIPNYRKNGTGIMLNLHVYTYMVDQGTVNQIGVFETPVI